MSRGQFRSRNTVGEIFSYQTDSNSLFDPSVLFLPGNPGRVHWNLGPTGPTGYTADNSLAYTFSDGGLLKTVEMRTNKLSNLRQFDSRSDNIVGHLDFNKWTNFGGYFNVSNNPSLTGITHTASTQEVISYDVFNCDLTGELDLSGLQYFLKYITTPFPIFNSGRFNAYNNPNLTRIKHHPNIIGSTFGYQVYNCDLQGELDMTMFYDLGTIFTCYNNPSLTGITHTASTRDWGLYRADNCDIIGRHDMTMFYDGLGGHFRINDNPNLTGIDHAYSSNAFTYYYAYDCDLTGNHDLTMLTGLGARFDAHNNPSLTGVTHTASTTVFTQYQLHDCDITGNHDLSMFPNFGGSFLIRNNSNLTGITHTYSNQTFTQYDANTCNLTGDLDLTMFPNLGGAFNVYNNTNLTSITHTASTQTFTTYSFHNCDITGDHDISMLSGLTTHIFGYNNNNMTNVILPPATGTFRNTSIREAISFESCDLGYVNFLPMAGITMDVGYIYGASIHLGSNSMTAAEVNHVLVDFDEIVTNQNPAGWTGVTLHIGGTNASPDTTSGGYDGVAAINSLTGATNNWTVFV